MIDDIKKELKKNPENLVELLDRFGYCNIVNHGDKYLSFGRDQFSSKKSIVIQLRNNDWLYVTDYARNVNADIISFIMTQRNVTFVEVLNQIKSILGITSFSDVYNKKKIFGGFYDSIRSKNKEIVVATYDESILNQFVIGIKIRCNYDVQDGEQKYWYLVPCRMSQTLYGYSQNYNHLVGNDIYIFESEKSTMQCHTYGIRNCVSLGSGTISSKQVKLLLELQPTRIIFMHDVGYPKESIMRNINMVKNYNRFLDIPVCYWDNHGYTGKDSPSDFGKEKLIQIMNEEIVEV